MKIQQLLSLALLGLFFLAASGCAADEEAASLSGRSDGDDVSFRAAGDGGSCATDVPNACGGQSSDGCWCDAECAEYGDCCDDKVDVCDTVFCESPDDCGADEYCHYAKDDACGATGSGECTPIPTDCDADDSAFNICGCDGRMFPTECAANQHGISRDPADACFADGSCKNRCDESSGSCYCDELCEQYGDCCDDYTLECNQAPPPVSTCEGACGEQAAAGCWCDEQCAEYGDCCEDKAEVCDAPPPIGCEVIRCGLGFQCVEDDAGNGSCEPADCGPFPPCPEGQECVAQDGFVWAVCVDIEEPAGNCLDGSVECGLGEFCNTCPSDCGGPICPAVCGEPRCEPVPAPGCELILCNVGSTCVEDETGAGECVPNPGSCGSNDDCAVGEICDMCPSNCAPGLICPAVCGTPECVLPPECAAITCVVGSQCGLNPATGVVGCF